MRHAERRRQTVMAGIWRQHQTPTGYDFRRARRLGRPRPARRAGSCRRARRRRARGVPGARAGASIVRVARPRDHAARGPDVLANRVYLGELRDGGRRQRRRVDLAAARQPGRARGDRAASSCSSASSDALAGRAPRGAARRAPAGAAGRRSMRCATYGHEMSRGRRRRMGYGCQNDHSAGRCPAPASIRTTLLDAYVGGLVREAIAGMDSRPRRRPGRAPRGGRDRARASSRATAGGRSRASCAPGSATTTPTPRRSPSSTPS